MVDFALRTIADISLRPELLNDNNNFEFLRGSRRHVRNGTKPMAPNWNSSALPDRVRAQGPKETVASKATQKVELD